MKEELIKMKKTLVVVDMVKGFKTKGNMAITDVDYIDDEVVELVEQFLSEGNDVISIQEGHTKTSEEFNSFPEHCILGTDEAELIDALEPFKNKMKLIRKNSTCGYIKEEFVDYLKQNKDELGEVVFVGVCMDICVANIAIPTKMFFNENNIACDVVVPLNATETYDSYEHPRSEYKVLAKKMLQLNGIKTPERYEGGLK